MHVPQRDLGPRDSQLFDQNGGVDDVLEEVDVSLLPPPSDRVLLAEEEVG